MLLMCKSWDWKEKHTSFFFFLINALYWSSLIPSWICELNFEQKSHVLRESLYHCGWTLKAGSLQNQRKPQRQVRDQGRFPGGCSLQQEVQLSSLGLTQSCRNECKVVYWYGEVWVEEETKQALIRTGICERGCRFQSEWKGTIISTKN